MKAKGQKISMLFVTTLEEAQAADRAGIDMLSIEGRFFSPEMREAAGDCFVQVGLPYGPHGDLVTAKDYLKSAFHFMALGGDCFYCAASIKIQKALCDNAVPSRSPRGTYSLAVHLDRRIRGCRQNSRKRKDGFGIT